MPLPGRSLWFAVLLLAGLGACAVPQPQPSPQPEEDEPTVLNDRPPEPPEEGEAGPIVVDERDEITPEQAYQAVDAAVSALPSDIQPVRAEGEPLARVADLTGDGQPEVVLLAVDASVEHPHEFEALSSYQRLFDPESVPIPFFLYVFARGADDELEVAHEIYLDERPGLVGFEAVRISQQTLPLAISIRFQSTEGVQDNWIIFSGAPDRYGRFTMETTVGQRWQRRDLDRDGTLDLVSFQSAYEDGVGRETLISWYRWDGRQYRLHRTRDIVRNLNQFLYEAREYLEEGDYDGFLEHALAAEEHRRVRELGLTPESVLGELFRPVASDEAYEAGEDGPNAGAPGEVESAEKLLGAEELERVVFPAITTTPFRLEPEQTRFTPVVRIEYRDGISGFYHTSIRMAYNPFDQQQFYFERQSRQPNRE